MELALAASVIATVTGVLALIVWLAPYPEDFETPLPRATPGRGPREPEVR